MAMNGLPGFGGPGGLGMLGQFLGLVKGMGGIGGGPALQQFPLSLLANEEFFSQLGALTSRRGNRTPRDWDDISRLVDTMGPMMGGNTQVVKDALTAVSSLNRMGRR